MAEVTTDIEDSKALGPHRSRRGVKVTVVALACSMVVAALLLLMLDRQRPHFAPAENRKLEHSLSRGRALAPLDVLVLGVDKSDHGTRRTDTIMLVRIDRIHSRSWVLSVPRDTDISGLQAWRRSAAGERFGSGPAKANAAYAYGGAALAVDCMEELLGVPVHHYVEVDFTAFRDAVDALGGVEIDVPATIDDRKAASASPGRRASHIPPGRQVLDGEHALTFVRTRKYSDADFSRMANQQSFLHALARTALRPASVVRWPAVVAVVAKGMKADQRTLPAALTLASVLPAAHPDRMSSATLSGQWRSPVVVTDENRKRELSVAMTELRAFPPPADQVPVLVLNGSGRPGAARRTARRLASAGFTIAGVANAPTNDYRGTTLRISDGDAAELGLRLALPGARVETAKSESLAARAVVIVGQ